MSKFIFSLLLCSVSIYCSRVEYIGKNQPNDSDAVGTPPGGTSDTPGSDFSVDGGGDATGGDGKDGGGDDQVGSGSDDGGGNDGDDIIDGVQNLRVGVITSSGLVPKLEPHCLETVGLEWATKSATGGVLSINNESISVKTEHTIEPAALPSGTFALKSANQDFIETGSYLAHIEATYSQTVPVKTEIQFKIKPYIEIFYPKNSPNPKAGKPTIIFVKTPCGADIVELKDEKDGKVLSTLTNLPPGVHQTQIIMPSAKEIDIIGKATQRNIESEPSKLDLKIDADCRDKADCAKKKFEEACKNSTQKIVKLSFAPTKDCEWGKNGNLNQKNGYLRARKELVQGITVENNQLLCGINSFSANQKIRFDDHFMFTFNDLLLASSFDSASPVLNSVQGYFLYSWENIRGQNGLDMTNHFDSTPYCHSSLGNLGESCKIPTHNINNQFQISVNQSTIQDLMVASELMGQSGKNDVKIVLFGDDDSQDCELKTENQSNLELQINISVADKLPE